MTEIKIRRDPNEIYQKELPNLSAKQVLVPRLSGTKVIGYRLRNIRRLGLGEIEAVMNNASSQLDEAKLARITAREERLRGMRS